MAEATEYISNKKEEGKQIKSFIKKFSKISPEKAKELRKKMQEKDLIKINEKHISKIIDLLPTDPEELNQIFTDIGLNNDEIEKTLETIKEFN